jgi:hypothetical protein
VEAIGKFVFVSFVFVSNCVAVGVQVEVALRVPQAAKEFAQIIGAESP